VTSHGEKVLRTPRWGNETEAREAGEDPGEAGVKKRKRQGAEEGPRWLLNSSHLSLRLTRRTSLCCLLSAGRENETPCLRSRVTQCHPTNPASGPEKSEIATFWRLYLRVIFSAYRLDCVLSGLRIGIPGCDNYREWHPIMYYISLNSLGKIQVVSYRSTISWNLYLLFFIFLIVSCIFILISLYFNNYTL